jgi:hypothetical protein
MTRAQQFKDSKGTKCDQICVTEQKFGTTLKHNSVKMIENCVFNTLFWIICIHNTCQRNQLTLEKLTMFYKATLGYCHLGKEKN